MSIRFYNTMTKYKQEFQPLNPPKVTMYNCGPTVYSYAHIGNFRSFLFADLLRRFLEFRGYEVTQVMNITDVGHLTEDDLEQGEDKIEAAARKEKKTPEEIARFYTEAFFHDLDLLKIKRAHYYPRASEHISEMIDLIKKLLEKGYAYISGDTVFYDISSFPRYGMLSGKKIEDLIAGAGGRLSEEQIAVKRNPLDFRLWKVDPKHLMKWESPWGVGYPGWHIECSVMAVKYLGETIDIHTGGEDNIFPHHESEIAQIEPVTGKQFVRYWMHVRHLMINGEKMSKSKGNTYRVTRYTEELGVSPEALRLALLSTHYRMPANLTDEKVLGSQENVNRIENFIHRMNHATGSGSQVKVREIIDRFKKKFNEAMDDDLNTSLGVASIMEFIREINSLDPARDGAVEAVEALKWADQVFAIIPEMKEEIIDETEIIELIKKREELRKQKRWAEADAIRDKLRERGIILEDTPQGTIWRVKK